MRRRLQTAAVALGLLAFLMLVVDLGLVWALVVTDTILAAVVLPGWFWRLRARAVRWLSPPPPSPPSPPPLPAARSAPYRLADRLEVPIDAVQEAAEEWACRYPRPELEPGWWGRRR
jgi:hypothetical protein